MVNWFEHLKIRHQYVLVISDVDLLLIASALVLAVLIPIVAVKPITPESLIKM